MKFARNILIASLVICFANLALASSPGASSSGTNALSSPVPFQAQNIPPASHCTGDFGAGTGICYLYEFADNSGNLFTDNAYSIDLHTTNVVTGVVQIREGPNYGPFDTSDALAFTQSCQTGICTTFVTLYSDPNIIPLTFDASTNESLGPCFVEENGVCNPGQAVWAPLGTANNQYFVYSEGTPEPGTLILLGTGLLGGMGVVRRRLM